MYYWKPSDRDQYFRGHRGRPRLWSQKSTATASAGYQYESLMERVKSSTRAWLKLQIICIVFIDLLDLWKTDQTSAGFHPQMKILQPLNRRLKTQDFASFIILERLEEAVPGLVCSTHALKNFQWVSATLLQSFRKIPSILMKIIHDMCRGGILQYAPPRRNEGTLC